MSAFFSHLTTRHLRVWIPGIYIAGLLLSLVIGEEAFRAALGFHKGTVSSMDHVWSIVTYTLVPGSLVNFAFNMLTIWFCSRMVEPAAGWRELGSVFAAGLLIPPLLALLLPFPSDTVMLGAAMTATAILISAALQNADQPVLLPGLSFLRFAILLTGLNFLISLTRHLYAEAAALVVIWAAVWIIHYGWTWPTRLAMMLPGNGNAGSWGRPEPVRKPSRQERSLRPKPQLTPEIIDVQRVDDLLEKISQHGMGSLTEEDRQRLARASDTLRRIDERSKLS